MKKLLMIFAVILTVFILSGCSKKSELLEIKAEEMFNQEGNYYVFFYTDAKEVTDETGETEQIKSIVESYVKAVKNENKYKDKSLIYSVNLSKDENKEILRKFVGDFGQGTNGDFQVDDVKNWKDLYIASAPSLISIKTNSQDVTYASFEAEGAQSIFEYLMGYLDN